MLEILYDAHGPSILLVPRNMAEPPTAVESRLQIQSHLRALTLLALLSRALILALVHLTSYLPLFDSSSLTLLPASTPAHTSALLRWDTFYFASIGRDGYQYEQQWAFFPGTPLLMHALGRVLATLKGTGDDAGAVGWTELLQAGALAGLVTCGSARTLYRLSLHHFHSPYFALLASLLSLLPSSPATLHYAGYTEPFFTFLSYRGNALPSSCMWLLQY